MPISTEKMLMFPIFSAEWVLCLKSLNWKFLQQLCFSPKQVGVSDMNPQLPYFYKLIANII